MRNVSYEKQASSTRIYQTPTVLVLMNDYNSDQIYRQVENRSKTIQYQEKLFLFEKGFKE